MRTMIANALTFALAAGLALAAFSSCSNDPTLDAELATGFYYLAQVQGNPYKPNLGNRAAALISYENGLAIERRSLLRQPIG